MTDREKLIELIIDAIRSHHFKSYRGRACGKTFDISEHIADHLLANGVIVPPCKVGDTVYVISETKIREAEIDEIHHYSKGLRIFVKFECDEDCEGCPFDAWYQTFCGEWDCNNIYGSAELAENEFGKTVFLSREDAEKALEERKEK